MYVTKAKKKISKRTREQAALWCAVMASNQRAYECTPVRDILDSFGISDEADRLAGAAYRHARGLRGFWGTLPTKHALTIYARAEALLRTGWSPS